MLLGKQLTMQEDRLRLRRRPQLQHMMRRMRGIVGTTRVLLRVMVRLLEVAEGLWCTMQPVWVLPRQQQEARPVRLARRLADKRCEVVRVRWTRPRQRGWPQVLR